MSSGSISIRVRHEALMFRVEVRDLRRRTCRSRNGEAGLCQERHRHQEFLRFLKHLARAYPDQQLHLVMDNYATHNRVEIRDWLDANPRIKVHFTPTSASWLNLVEVWFGVIERQAIHRGTFRGVGELITATKNFIAGWNVRAHPFVWTKTADEILKKADRQIFSNTDH
jgi:transposase